MHTSDHVKVSVSATIGRTHTSDRCSNRRDGALRIPSIGIREAIDIDPQFSGYVGWHAGAGEIERVLTVSASATIGRRHTIGHVTVSVSATIGRTHTFDRDTADRQQAQEHLRGCWHEDLC